MSDEPDLYDIFLEELDSGIPPTKQDLDMARGAFHDRGVLRVMAKVVRAFRADAASTALDLDFSDPKSVVTVSRQQGSAQGALSVIENLFDFLEEVT